MSVQSLRQLDLQNFVNLLNQSGKVKMSDLNKLSALMMDDSLSWSDKFFIGLMIKQIHRNWEKLVID